MSRQRVPMVESFGQALRRRRESAGLSQPELARRVPVSQSSLSRYERGLQAIDPSTAERLDEILGANGELRAMLAPAKLDAVAAPVDELDRPAGADYVDGLRDAVRHLVALDGLHGGDDLSRVAVRLFRSAHRKLSGGHYEPVVERDLESATAELGEVAGWLFYDADRQDESRRINLEALAMARLAGDRSMELFVLANTSMQSLYADRPREALRIADNALRDNRLPPRVATLFRLRRARALAHLGDRGTAIAEMRRARSGLADGLRHSDPAWTWWIDDAELAWHEGMLHASLNDWSAAVDRFDIAVCHKDSRRRRGRYVLGSHLLDALVRVADWPRAETVAVDVLSLAGEVGSGRTTALLRRTAALVARSPAPSAVGGLFAELDRRLAL